MIQRIHLFIFILLAGNAYCQTPDSSKLVVHVFPSYATVILDTFHIQTKGLLVLSPGEHVIKAWATKRKLVIDTLFTVRDSVSIYIRNLPFTESFLQYRAHIRKAKSKSLIPLVATVVVVYGSKIAHEGLSSKLDRYAESATEAKAYYDLAITQSQLDYYKSQYSAYNDKYNHARTLNNVVVAGSAVLATAGIAATAYILIKKHPSYTEHPLLSNVNAGFLYGGESAIAGILTYKF